MTIPIQITLIGIITISYILKKVGLLNQSIANPLSEILMKLLLPILIIGVISNAKITTELSLISLSAFIILTLFLVLGWAISRKLERKSAKTFTLLMGTYWGATLAFPFILSAYGEAGIKVFIFYELVHILFLSIVIPFVATRANFQTSIKKATQNPLFIGLIIALLLNFMGWPILIWDHISLLISLSIVLIGLIIVGLNFELKITSLKIPLLLITLKTVMGFALALFLAKIFNLSELNRTILIVVATLPPSLLVIIFSQKHHLDSKLAASTISLSLPISIVVMTLISVFF